MVAENMGEGYGTRESTNEREREITCEGQGHRESHG